MALSQKTKNIFAALAMSKEGFRGHMDRQYEATKTEREEKKEMGTFKEKETFKAGLKEKKDPEEEFKKFTRKEEFKSRLKQETDQANVLGLSVDEYRSAVEKAAEKNMDVLDYLEGVKSEQEATLQAKRGPGISSVGMVGATKTMQRLGQRYFGKKEQPASTQASQEPTAINRKTGERLVYRGGKWQSLK